MPLWIGGRACLTMPDGVEDVCNPLTGQCLRRIPRCGGAEVRHAAFAAQRAVGGWSHLTAAARAALLEAWADTLTHYHDHFCRLIMEDAGVEAANAAAEIAAALAVLRAQPVTSSGIRGVVGGIGVSDSPLVSLLSFAAPLLREGSVLVLRTSPKTPAVQLAMVELTACCGFPGGVVNMLHGDESLVERFAAHGLTTHFF